MLLSRPVSILPLPEPGAPSDWSWLVLALLGACAVALWVLVARLGEIERRLKQLASNDEASSGAASGGKPREVVDLRRVEQVLGEIRDGSKRLEDALLRTRTTSRAGAESAGGADLGERVMNRMLALGYDRVVLITPREKFAAIEQDGGEVRVEARRDGAPCKGKAIFQAGVLTDVAMQSAYATFP